MAVIHQQNPFSREYVDAASGLDRLRLFLIAPPDEELKQAHASLCTAGTGQPARGRDVLFRKCRLQGAVMPTPGNSHLPSRHLDSNDSRRY